MKLYAQRDPGTLDQMTDEMMINWARSMCAATCADWPPGKHAANCPVADLGL